MFYKTINYVFLFGKKIYINEKIAVGSDGHRFDANPYTRSAQLELTTAETIEYEYGTTKRSKLANTSQPKKCIYIL